MEYKTGESIRVGDIISYDDRTHLAQVLKIIDDDKEELKKTGCDYFGVYLLVDMEKSNSLEYWDMESFFDADVCFEKRATIPEEWKNLWKKVGYE